MDKRRNPEGNQNYSIETLWEHQHEICRRLALGHRPNRIADDLGVTTQTISNVRNSPLAQAKILQLQEGRDIEVVQINKRVREMAPLALDILEKTLNHASDTLEVDKDARAHGLSAAKNVLEHAIPKKVEGRIVHGHIPLSMLEKMKERVNNDRALSADVANVQEVESV